MAQRIVSIVLGTGQTTGINMKKADKAALIEAYRAKTWSGQIIQTRKKPVADTPIFKAMEQEKQLEIFNIK
jgi:alpha-D-ribose 1-methylphosphonate 5-triphosphate synthase subunit PhnG